MKLDRIKMDNFIEEGLKEYRKNGKSEYFKTICKQVIETQDPVTNYLFAREVPTCFVKAHGYVVNKFGTDEIIYKYATEIQGADISEAKQALKKRASYKLLKQLVYETTPINEL